MDAMYRRMLVEEPQQLESLFTDRFLSSNCDAPPRLSRYADAGDLFVNVLLTISSEIGRHLPMKSTTLTLLYAVCGSVCGVVRGVSTDEFRHARSDVR